MQLSGQHIAGGIGLVFAAMFAWFAALWLNLQGANLWFVRLCIFLLLGLAVVAVVWWLHNRKKNAPSRQGSENSESVSTPGATDDILLILREAEARVASSTQLPRGTRLSSLPVIFLVGGASGGKTCVAAQSGLDPELISGQVYSEGSIAPTRLANLWFARKTVFVEMGGRTLGDANLWNRLLRRIAPGKLRSIFSGKPAAPRAAVVCYDSTRFAKAASSEEIIAEARVIRARLQQIALTLGISFPVYVLFTQADRLPYFEDFFRNLSDPEISQVLGATLPPFPATASGVYAEQETKRLNNAFNSIFHSLAECRPGLLYRERGADKLPGIYEFPRELQKRIPVATQFLVDLCRPSHLRSGPFLRGFYFTGIRQVETSAPLGGTMIASKTSVMPARNFSANATSIMRAEDFTRTQGWQSATQAGFARESGKTTQWLFLSHIFSHIILQDHTALGASGRSSRANVWKRVILATVGALAAIWFLGMVISFFGNRALEEDVRRAVEAIATIQTQALSTASLEDLQHLESAREQLARLNQYKRGASPWHLHWGLYSGEALYNDLRPLYFDRFKKLLFGDVQGQMATSLRNYPASPANPTDEDYRTAYDTLKAFLMTTSMPKKSDTPFLSQILLDRWGGSSASEDQKKLALSQFQFYADELRIENPFPGNDDALAKEAVEQSRTYLNAFNSTNLVYRNYVARLHRSCSECGPLDFSKKYSEAGGVVREPKVVDAAFTKKGWNYMQKLLSENESSNDDDWVLPGAVQGQARRINANEVRKAYESEYIREWQDYVKSASVGLSGAADASRKLRELTGNRSPLFELFCEVSQNTAGTSEEIMTAFQPVSDVVKFPCERQPGQGTTEAYVNALIAFKSCLDTPQPNNAPTPAAPAVDPYTDCKTNKRLLNPVHTEAVKVVKTVDRKADLDRCVVSLLDLGSCSKTAVIREELRTDSFCKALNSLSSKYPFKVDGPDATLEEFEAFFRQGGTLSREIASGPPKTGSRANLIRQAQAIQNSLYPNGSLIPQFQFTVTKTVPMGMKSAQLDLDGSMLKVDEGPSRTQAFTWPGKTHEAELKFGDSKYYGPFDGPWAVFRLLGNYTWLTSKGVSHLESPPLKSPQGLTFRDTLELKTSGIPLFKRGYLSQLRCSH